VDGGWDQVGYCDWVVDVETEASDSTIDRRYATGVTIICTITTRFTQHISLEESRNAFACSYRYVSLLIDIPDFYPLIILQDRAR